VRGREKKERKETNTALLFVISDWLKGTVNKQLEFPKNKTILFVGLRLYPNLDHKTLIIRY
jgi:hypothetical protein